MTNPILRSTSTGKNWFDNERRGSDEAVRQNINMMSSTMQVGGSSTFGMANDRFVNPTQKVKAPAPFAYKQSETLGVDRFKNSPY